jgi:hypothetical protein
MAPFGWSEMLMSSWLANPVIAGGGVVVIVGVIGANVVFVQFLSRRTTTIVPKSRSIATLEAIVRLLLFSSVFAVGLTILLMGEVIGYGLPKWAPALPVALMLGSVATAWYARRLARQLRASQV